LTGARISYLCVEDSELQYSLLVYGTDVHTAFRLSNGESGNKAVIWYIFEFIYWSFI